MAVWRGLNKQPSLSGLQEVEEVSSKNHQQSRPWKSRFDVLNNLADFKQTKKKHSNSICELVGILTSSGLDEK